MHLITKRLAASPEKTLTHSADYSTAYAAFYHLYYTILNSICHALFQKYQRPQGILLVPYQKTFINRYDSIDFEQKMVYNVNQEQA